jgi:hypothetical protein
MQQLWRRTRQYSDRRIIVVLGDGQRGVPALGLRSVGRRFLLDLVLDRRVHEPPGTR